MHVVAAAAGRDVVDVRQRNECAASSFLAKAHVTLFLHMPNWGDMPVWLCGGTTSLAEDPTIHASTPWCQVSVFVMFCFPAT